VRATRAHGGGGSQASGGVTRTRPITSRFVDQSLARASSHRDWWINHSHALHHIANCDSIAAGT